jgi:hypothetical protein
MMNLIRARTGMLLGDAMEVVKLTQALDVLAAPALCCRVVCQRLRRTLLRLRVIRRNWLGENPS